MRSKHVAEPRALGDLRAGRGHDFRRHHAVFHQQIVQAVGIDRPTHVHGRSVAQVDFAFVAGLVGDDEIAGELLAVKLLQQTRERPLFERPLNCRLLCAVL
jgi:hypothetical protein